MRALVVDDEPLLRMRVRDLLEEAGFECEEAADAAKALALLDAGGWTPDILVTDFNLGPGPDGIALAEAALRRLPDLSVLYVTGNPEHFDDLMLGPRQCLLAKPFAPTDLIATICAEAVAEKETRRLPGEASRSYCSSQALHPPLPKLPPSCAIRVGIRSERWGRRHQRQLRRGPPQPWMARAVALGPSPWSSPHGTEPGVAGEEVEAEANAPQPVKSGGAMASGEEDRAAQRADMVFLAIVLSVAAGEVILLRSLLL